MQRLLILFLTICMLIFVLIMIVVTKRKIKNLQSTQINNNVRTTLQTKFAFSNKLSAGFNFVHRTS